ncbi:MAG TPA: tellurite resistance TerB family protein, partial [Devosiaceae bacterium]|nr:tellurite resistance TerB family protein [Devosiaceae bacterium]
MQLSSQDALIYLMVVAASADAAMTDRELARIETLIEQLPVFAGYDRSRLPQVANECVDLINGANDVERVLDMV